MYKIGIQIIDKSVINRDLCIKVIKINKANKKISNIKFKMNNQEVIEIFDFTGFFNIFHVDENWTNLEYFLKEIKLKDKQYKLYKLIGGKWFVLRNINNLYLYTKEIVEEISIYRQKIMEKERRLYGEIKDMKMFKDREILNKEEKHDMKKIIRFFPTITPNDSLQTLIIKISKIYPNRAFLYNDLASDINNYFKINHL